MKVKIPRAATTVCRIVLGMVFVFSGFVKAIDPLGSAYKFHDYFTAWTWPALDCLSVPLAFGLSAFEFVLGVCLVAGLYRRYASWLALLTMLFMTPLTLYLAIYNPVSDCGCFGDALVITNWQTFWKNIVLLALAVVCFLHDGLTKTSGRQSPWWGIGAAVAILGFSGYCYNYLPVLDFRPYKVGADIPALMESEEDTYKTTLIYEKDGVRKEFTLSDYPANDTTWRYVETLSVLTKKGKESPIHDFSITDADGTVITDEVLADTSCVFLLIARKLELASSVHSAQINELYDFADSHGYRFLCLTASLPADIAEWKANTGAAYPFCFTDDTTLKTIVRSNPGLLLLKKGVIVGKWGHNSLPETDDLAGIKLAGIR